MRHFSVCAVFVALGWAASPAAGQGLYGAPQMLPLAPASPEIASQPGYLLPPSGYGSLPAGYAGAQQAYPQAQYPQAQYAQTQYPQTQYPQLQPAARGMYGPAPAAARSGPSGYAPARPGPGYYGNYAPGYPARMAAAGPAGGTPASVPAPPNNQPLAPIPQSMPHQQPSGPMFDDAGYGANCSACGQGRRSFAAICGFDQDPCFQPKWYGSAAGLFLTRDDANGVWTTNATGSTAPLMRTTDADVGWQGGYDVKIGAYLGPCNNWSIEGGYWTIDRFSGFAGMSLLPLNTVGTPLIVDNIEFAGVNGDHFFNTAAAHRIWRTDRVQSAEASLVYKFTGGDPGYCSPFDVSVLAGARYFVFDENLTFGSLANGGSWGGNDGLDEAYLKDSISNSLIGFQFGFDAGYHVFRTVRLFVSPRMGFYDNHIQARFDAFRGDGTHATPTPASGVVASYPVSADKDVFSFLGQIDAGLDWEFSPHWTAFLGYRLVAATGIGLADHQIPADVLDVSALSDIKHNGNLLVHGALAGLKVAF